MSPHSDVDLHLHSTASDGVLDPAALVAYVTKCGVTLMALTDHDTVAGVDAAAVAARTHGIGFIPGVELSVSWRARSLHLLGLGIDPGSSVLRKSMENIAVLRDARAERIAAALDKARAPGTAALAQIRAAGSLPTRTHFARALVALGAATDVGAAFERFLGRGRPGSVKASWPAIEDAIGWIKGAGGRAVIAHPMRYPLSAGARRELCAEFKAAGGDGIEVITGGGGVNDRERAISLAVRSGLAGSVGSDFHDPAIPWNPPGRLAKLPSSIPPVWSGLLPA